MLGRDSEDEIWSRFVFELVLWPQEVTLVSRTQPSGPLCLWQCFSCKANFCDNMWSGDHPHRPTTHRIHIIWPFAFSVINMNGWKSSGEWCYHCVWTISKAHVLYKVIFLMTMFTLYQWEKIGCLSCVSRNKIELIRIQSTPHR